MIVLLMGVASVTGAICALIAFLILRTKNRSAPRLCLSIGLFPPITMGYLLACLIFSSIVSGKLGTPDLFFGDIKEALPNGYTLEALSKMPESGIIHKPGNNSTQVAWVGGLQVEGPYVFGKYDYTDFPRTAEEAGIDFFSLDTRTGEIRNFASEAELRTSAEANIHLTPTANFRGPISSQQRQSTILFFLILTVPPLALDLWLMWRFIAFWSGR